MIYQEDLAQQYLASLKSRESFFKYIPKDIGEIVFCYTDNPKNEQNYLPKRSLKVKLITLLIAALIIAGCWLLFHEHYIICSIVTIVMAFIADPRDPKESDALLFSGKDYFVGTEGYEFIEFNGTRDHITANTKHFFHHFDDLLSAVEDEERYEYDVALELIGKIIKKTYYHFTAYSPQINGKRTIVDHIHQKFKLSPDFEMYLWKWIEATWSHYKFNQMREAYNNGEAIGFNVYTKEGYSNDYIMLKGENISVGGNVYDFNNTQDIVIEEAQLVIKHPNYKSYVLFESGDKIAIPLHNIGNRDLFFKIFHIWRDEYCPNRNDLFQSMVVTEEIGEGEHIEDTSEAAEAIEEPDMDVFDPFIKIGSILPETSNPKYDESSWIWDPPQTINNTGWNKQPEWNTLNT